MGDIARCEKCLHKLHKREEATDCYFIYHQIHKLSFIYSDDKMIKDIGNVLMQSDNANG